MRVMTSALIAFTMTSALPSLARADNAAELKTVVENVIKAHGGEAELKKLQATTQKLKGNINTQGVEIAFTAEVVTSGQDRMRMDFDGDVSGQKIHLFLIFNRTKGWLKINDDTKEMEKEQVAEHLEKGNASWIATLIPLRDKAYTVSLVGEDKVGTTPAVVLRVERKNFRDVTLFFDKKTHLLLKAETRVKEDGTGQEVSEETFFSDYTNDALRRPKKLVVKHDSKPFLDMEITEFKAEEKIDDSLFDKP